MCLIVFCLQGMVFDYYVDDASCSMVPWENKVPSFSYMPDNFSSLFVPTVDTTRLTYFLDTLIAKKHYVMFVGNTGTLSHADQNSNTCQHQYTIKQTLIPARGVCTAFATVYNCQKQNCTCS